MEEVNCCQTETEKEDIKNKSTAADDDDGGGDDKSVSVHSNDLRKLSGPIRRSSKANWTEEEDDILRDAVQKYEGKSWKKIAECLVGRTDVQCLHRWQKVLNPDLVKGSWTKEEDNLLVELVDKFGEKKWSEIAEQLAGRMGKQCRERWYNHLKPEINKAAWTNEEEKILINAHAEYGNKWSVLAKLLPGRTENSVKNHWNCSLKKKKLCYYSDVTLPNLQHNHKGLTHPPFSDDSKRPKKVVGAEEHPTTICSWKEREGFTTFDENDRRQTGVYDNPGSSSEWSYSGLCYEPIQGEDLDTFLSSGRFASEMKEQCDSYSRMRFILRRAAMSYGNMPSIIRKGAFKMVRDNGIGGFEYRSRRE